MLETHRCTCTARYLLSTQEIANDSDYGLAAGVWSASIDNAVVCTERLEAGTVWVNGMMSSWGYNAPFGG